jgi:type II secretory ATPase GspE/PulE/Tfp pilus assembly ATPase PilB-like protein
MEQIGQILLRRGLVSGDKLKDALLLQETQEYRLIGEILVEKKYITEDDLLESLAEQYNFTCLKSINPDDVDVELCKKVDETLAFLFDKCFLILKDKNNKVKVVCYRLDLEITSRVSFIIDYDIMLAQKSIIYDALNTKFIIKGDDRVQKDDAVKLLNQVIEIGIARKSPNIRIKYAIDSFYLNLDTIDGQVESFRSISVNVGIAIVNIIAGNCKTTLIPGKPASANFLHKSKLVDKDIDIRVEFIPIAVNAATTSNIFEAVLRIHYSYSKDFLDINNLGFNSHQVNLLKLVKKFSHGIIISTGPTGSGKTTTFYSLIKNLSDMRKTIFTIEDPVENHFSETNITQMSIKEKGLDFPDAIRSVLRCEPKIIMVGEIRDKHTAEAALSAAETGHLVLTTVHANSALASFRRLETLGINITRFIDSIRMITSQRLYIELCPACKIKEPVQKDVSILLNNAYKDLKPFYEDFEEFQNIVIREDISIKRVEEIFIRNKKGCKNCNYTGYKKNKRAIIEIALFDDEMRQLVVDTKTVFELENAFIKKRSFLPIKVYAFSLLIKGIIDVEQYFSMVG